MYNKIMKCPFYRNINLTIFGFETLHFFLIHLSPWGQLVNIPQNANAKLKNLDSLEHSLVFVLKMRVVNEKHLQCDRVFKVL